VTFDAVLLNASPTPIARTISIALATRSQANQTECQRSGPDTAAIRPGKTEDSGSEENVTPRKGKTSAATDARTDSLEIERPDCSGALGLGLFLSLAIRPRECQEARAAQLRNLNKNFVSTGQNSGPNLFPLSLTVCPEGSPRLPPPPLPRLQRTRWRTG
jgi:hypothetical protein